MNTVKVRNIILGEGMPKICVPVTDARKRKSACVWRRPWRQRRICWSGERTGMSRRWRGTPPGAAGFSAGGPGERPLLVTFRTREEGGEQEAPREAYEAFLDTVLESGKADLIDVELFRGEELPQKYLPESSRSRRGGGSLQP